MIRLFTATLIILFLLTLIGCGSNGNDGLSLLSDPGNLEGRVLTPGKERVTGASISLRGKDFTFLQNSTTNFDGDFFFKSLTSGVYELGIQKSGFADFSQEVVVMPQKTGSYTVTLAAVSTETIELSGVLLEDLVLEADGPKVVFRGDFLIPKGVTLMASEGVVFEFSATDSKNSGDYADLVELIVEGALVASGTDESPVIFRPESGTTAGSWGQIKFIGGSGTSRIAGAQITGAMIGVHLLNTTTEVGKNSITHSKSEGIFAEGGNFSSISGNNITGSGGDGIRIAFDATPVVSNNTVKSNSKSGISLFKAAGVIQGNTIESNLSNGIEMFSSSPTIGSNSFAYNSQNGLYIEYCSGAVSGNIIVSNGESGVRLIGTTTTVLSNNYLVQNGALGIQSSSKVRANIQGNIISGNGTGGYLTESSQSNIINNIITGNTGPGIWGQASTTDILNYNVIVGNNGQGVVANDAQMTLRNNIIQGNLVGISCTGSYFPDSDYNIYYKNTTLAQGFTLGGSDQTALDPVFIDPKPGVPWLGDFSLATATMILNKGVGKSDPGLLTPASVGQLASSTLGYGHLPLF